MVHEIDGAGKCEEDDTHDQSVTDEIAQGVGECGAEECDCLVITQQMQQLKLSDECNDTDLNQIVLIVLHNRLKAHDFS